MADLTRKAPISEIQHRESAPVPTSGREDGSGKIGGRLEQVRALLGLKQMEMAAAMGVSLRSYHRYRSDEAPLSAPEMARLADLAVDLHWLVTGVGSPIRHAAPAATGETESTPLLEDLLENVIRSVELYLESRGLGLAPDRKARLVVVLYRIWERVRVKRAAEGEPFPEGVPGAVIALETEPSFADLVRLAQ